jgi:hypothetical protein
MVGSNASVSGAAKPSGPACPTSAIADCGAAPKPRQRKVALRAECGGEQAGQRWINSGQMKSQTANEGRRKMTTTSDTEMEWERDLEDVGGGPGWHEIIAEAITLSMKPGETIEDEKRFAEIEDILRFAIGVKRRKRAA